jgi:tetratricopeptide (TPR) repeat protein
MARWHCKIGDVRHGPISSQELKWLAADGELRPTDLVKRDGDAAWTRASAVRGLFATHDPTRAGEVVAESTEAEASSRSRPNAAPVTRSREQAATVSDPAPATPRRKLSSRDALGLVAIGLSIVLLAGAVWYAFTGSSDGLPLGDDTVVAKNPGSHVASPDRSADEADRDSERVDASSTGMGSDSADGQVNDENPAIPATSAAADAPSAVDSANVVSTEFAASPARPTDAPPSTPRNVEVPTPSEPKSDLDLDEPVSAVRPAEFQAPERAVEEPAGPFAPASVPVPLSGTQAAIGPGSADDEAVPADPRDEAHRKKVEQLFEQTRKLLSDSRVAQDAVTAVRNEVQLAQGVVNAAPVQIQTLTANLLEIQLKLGGPPMPLAQKNLLRNQAGAIQKALPILAQQHANAQQALQQVLPRKLNVAESNAIEAASKCDAMIPGWIALADPFGEQSRVAHQSVAELCSEWLASDPGFVPAIMMRGFASWHAGDSGSALQDFDQVVQLAERHASTANVQALLATGLSARAVLYAQQKQEAQSQADQGKAAELCPKSALVWIFRGRANAALGKSRSAVDDFLRATKLDSKEPAAFRELAWLLASSPTLGQTARAVEFGRTACDLTKWNQWQCLDAYALANAADGKFPLAIATARNAHDFAPYNVRPEIEQRLKLYQAGVVPQNMHQR